MKTGKRPIIKILTLSVTFIFLLSSFAIAASSNLSINSDVSSDYILEKLGFIKNSDNAVNPNETISRAELAKIAVYMAGKQTSIEDMRKMSSKFSDVQPGDWFNGYINIVEAAGLMKGDANGNFYPERKATQSEVLTVSLRILGYNDNLPGDWPADYIAKAANNGFDFGNIMFIDNKKASCEVVCFICNFTLDQYVVNYHDDTQKFENDLKIEADLIANGDPQKKVPYTLRQLVLKTIK